MSNNENPTNGRLTSYEWQRAILASDLPSTTKLVLMALSTHINKGTGLAFPSIRILMEDTGLSNKAVVDHLGGAKKAGWIETGNHGYHDQRWARKSYRPQIPVNLRGGERRTPPFDVKVVNVVHEGGERHSQGGERRTPPFDAKNALEPVPVLACSDSQAALPLINNRLTIERGEVSPLNPSLSPSNFSFSSMEELPEAGGNSELGCQNQAVRIASKANGKPPTEKKRRRQGNRAGQPLPASWALSDDDIKASMERTNWSEAKVKDEASKFRDYYMSEGTLSHDWQAKWRLWERRDAEWKSREREHMRANGKVERTAPRPPVFVAEPKAPIDPTKPRPSHMPMLLAEIARMAAQP